MALSWLDTGLIVFMLFHVLLGIRQGLVIGLASMAGLVLALAAALYGAPLLAARLAPFLPWPVAVVALVLAALSFIVLHVVVGLGAGRARAWVERRGLAKADAWLGLGAGAVWGLIGALLIAWAFRQFMGQLPPNSPLSTALLAAAAGPLQAVGARLPAQVPAIVLLPSGWTLVEGPEDRAVPPSDMERQMLALVNKERKAKGLTALAWDPKAAAVARAHSQDMLKRDYFAHEDPQGGTVADRARKGGVGYLLIGENLAFAPSLAIAHQGLMDSPGHRENILRPGFRRLGIGIVRLKPGEDYRPNRPGEKAGPLPLRGVGGYLMITQVFRAP